MTAVTLPGQLELATVIDHRVGVSSLPREEGNIWMAKEIAKLLRQYEERPTSETWSRIQALAAEILR